jgi:hypothetical protein
MKVCEKVRQKGVTTYSQVADELVNEYCSIEQQRQQQAARNLAGSVFNSQTNNNNNNSAGKEDSKSIDFLTYDQKNVRRRVYDALNVLMAMKIISKCKKEIRWIGLPSNKKQECQELEAERKQKEERIREKVELLKNLMIEVRI